PVKYTLPGRNSESGPGPEPTSTRPTCEPAGHDRCTFSCAPLEDAAWAISALVHNGTPASLAKSPSGNVTEKPENSWYVSLRWNETANGVNAPARGFRDPARNDGLKPDTHLLEIVKDVEGVAIGPEDHGSTRVATVSVAH